MRDVTTPTGHLETDGIASQSPDLNIIVGLHKETSDTETA